MAQNRDLTGNVTFDSSPGGLFDTGGDATAAAAANEAGGDSQEFALDSKGWAIGVNTGSTKGYTPTNNSKYYSEVADSEAQVAAAAAITATAAAAEAKADSEEIARAIEGIDSDVAAARAAATAAAASAMEADSDARAAAMVVAAVDSDARAAAAAAAEAKADSDGAASSAAAALIYRDQAQQADSDATQQAILAQERAADAQIFRNAAQAAAAAAARDSEEVAGQIVNVTAYLNALEARVRQDSEEAADSARDAQQYEEQAMAQFIAARREAVRARSWAVGPSGDTDTSGTDTDNARYWAERAMAASLDTDVSDSEITLRTSLGINGGGSFTLNQHMNETFNLSLDSDNITNATRAGNTITLTKADGTTLEFTIGGGGGGGQEPDLRISLSPSEVELQATGTQTVNATFSASGFTLSNVTFTVQDPDNNNVPVSGTGNARSVTVSRTTARVVTMTVGATLTRTSDNMVFEGQTATARFTVAPGWYRDVGPQPSAITDMDNQGVWHNSNDNTQTITANNSNRNLYYALPTRTGGYRFHSGFVVYSDTNLGAISADWTLYRVDDFDDSQTGATFTVEIEEA